MTRKEMTKQNLSENIGVISCASSMITTRDLSPCSTLDQIAPITVYIISQRADHSQPCNNHSFC
jgi:hypothetical protein